eukprot:2397989-Amphidinium_carterae.2
MGSESSSSQCRNMEIASADVGREAPDKKKKTRAQQMGAESEVLLPEMSAHSGELDVLVGHLSSLRSKSPMLFVCLNELSLQRQAAPKPAWPWTQHVTKSSRRSH